MGLRGVLAKKCLWTRQGGRVNNKFFIWQVCDCPLLAQTLHYGQEAAQK
jgi:hypothetical protein